MLFPEYGQGFFCNHETLAYVCSDGHIVLLAEENTQTAIKKKIAVVVLKANYCGTHMAINKFTKANCF